MEQAIQDTCGAAAALLDEYAPVDIACERYTEKDLHPGGQEAFTIRARLPWHRQLHTRVMIEVTVDEKVLKPVQNRKVIHEYGEPVEVQVQVYALEEIVAEKLRAILQHIEKLHERGWSRSRARDYYDLWRVMGTYRDQMDLSDFVSFLREKCAVRNVSFDGPALAQLLPVSPHSGQTVWWSNWGNTSDARLSGRFDLSALDQATLRFWTWFDLEDRYDYVYLSASGDGGQTWQVLHGRYASARGDYGPAYNGQSDGWVEEQVDLSRYAGGEVWLRFDYVTDSSINGSGFMIDDISIPEMNLSDPCDDEGAWLAEGFVLVGPLLPQHWLVQLVEFPAAGAPQVRRMEMDAQQDGWLDLDLGRDNERALLVISPLVRYITTPLSYSYEISTR
jgi:hypothetical protein